MNSLLELFCHVDTFCCRFEPQQRQKALPTNKPTRNRKRSLCLSEVMTLLIWFHRSGYRTFKDFYCQYVQVHWRQEFPGLVSYNRFLEFLPSTVLALCAYLQTCLGKQTGWAFVDSTALAVCENNRISQHKVFAGVAKRGKTSVGWFFGFKLHLLINHCGELLSVKVTPGNVDDRKPVPELAKGLVGKLYGDKGYLSSSLGERLLEQGLHLVTRVRKGMAPVSLSDDDKAMLCHRSLIESVIERLKEGCQVEHTRHRSVRNALAHLVSGLIAYCHLPEKPSLRGFLPQITPP